MDIRQLAADILKKTPAEAEVFILRSGTLSIEVIDQKVKSMDKGEDFGIGLRVLKDKRMGFAFSSDIKTDVLITSAMENSANMPVDACNCFSAPSPENTAGLDLFDPEIGAASDTEKIEKAKAIEKAARSCDDRIKKTESTGYSEGTVEIAITNSGGVERYYKANECGGFVQVICEAGGEAEEGSAIEAYRKWKSFDAAKIGKEAGRKAVELFGGRLIKSGKMPVIFDPLVAAEFLTAISGLLSAEAAQKGRSAFSGRTGKAVAGKNISIIDDGLLKDGLSCAPFDAEGTSCGKNILIDKGILRTFMHNCYTASKDGTVSTGNAGRYSFKTTPAIRASNLYFENGKKTPESILSSVSSGLYVSRVMAMHSVNPVSGDFSVGAAGVMIENGKKAFPVRGVTIAGNLIELLSGIEELGSDLRFFPETGNCGSPTLLISSLSIGGE